MTHVSSSTDRSLRAVPTAAAGARGSSLTSQIDRLCTATWPIRWELLATDERLLDPRVAKQCLASDVLLSVVVARGAEAGVVRAREGFPLARTLIDVPLLTAADDLSDAVRAVCQGVDQGPGWLEPVMGPAIEHLSSLVVEEERDALGTAAYQYLAHVCASDPGLLAGARRLATIPWSDVWTELRHLTQPGKSAKAARAVSQWGRWFEPRSGLAGRADELADLLISAKERGTETAIWEHRMILAVQELLRDDAMPAEERSRLFSRLATKLGLHYDRTGARWVLSSMGEATSMAVSLTARSNPDYAYFATQFSSYLAVAAAAGAEDKSAYIKAICVQREAVHRTDPWHAKFPMRACLLSSRISDAIKAGVVDKSAYGECLRYQRQAASLAERSDPHYRAYLSALSTRTAEATDAGFVGSDQ